MTSGGRVALQEPDNSDNEQDCGPGAIEAHDVQALQEKQYADSEQHGRAHDFAHAAAITLATGTASSDQSPLPGEHPTAKKNQNQRPEAVEAKLEDVHGVQQKKHTQANQDDGNKGNVLGFRPVSHAERLRQAEWIRRGQAFLQRTGSAHGIDDLVDVEKRDAEAEDEIQTAGVIGTEDEQSKDEKVCESLRILRTVNGADAEGKKAGQNARDGGIGARASVTRS